MTPRAGLLSLAAAALCCASPQAARADGGDGVYGRFDGDIELRAAVGAGFASGGPSLDASLAALYMSTAGIYVHYTDACGSSAPVVARSIATGVHLAPLFLLRGALNGERGPAFVDLLIDSFAFELGAVWSATRTIASTLPYPAPPATVSSKLDDTPGLEAALGIDIPLMARASGPFIGVRAALRWRPPDFAPGDMPTTVASRGALVSITFGWHQVVGTHLIDPGDRVIR